MKPIFSKAPPLGIRLILAIIASVLLMIGDGRTSGMIQLRSLMETSISGIFYFANIPRTVLDGVSDNLADTSKLQIENRVLKEQLREKNADLLILDQLKVENQRLRLLLNSPLRYDEYKKIAEVLTTETDIYRQQVVINQGSRDGVYVGQPIIDEKGVVGQVTSVGATTSRVLLITDVTHSIPLQVLRNDVRLIASGTGRGDELQLDNVPHSVDIVKGDLLVTSGLGGRFPEGYPVAIVDSVSTDKQNYFAVITAKPLASLERLRYLLLLWPVNDELHRAQSLSPEDVRNAVRQRLSTRQDDLMAPDELNKNVKEPINPNQAEENSGQAEELAPADANQQQQDALTTEGSQ
ncbi:rod shape-determining protein MreC [Testudinibacter sp. P80/BLE/0925]|uniref:rod shape-determining protein MreC n=1 Tax=Testudinibacter sp. TW-1 TaxID=3417757 RepID=UPI003D35CB34